MPAELDITVSVVQVGKRIYHRTRAAVPEYHGRLVDPVLAQGNEAVAAWFEFDMDDRALVFLENAAGKGGGTDQGIDLYRLFEARNDTTLQDDRCRQRRDKYSFSFHQEHPSFEHTKRGPECQPPAPSVA